MPPDSDYIFKTIVEGILMKLGDVILMHSPGAIKKGVIVTVILVRRKLKKPSKKNGTPRAK